MERPKLGDAHARLHVLVGQWGGEETLYPAPWDPAGGSATAFVVNRVVLNGLAVVQEYEQYRDGTPTFSGHGLFWWDAAASQYAMTWFDSMMGTPATYRGAFDGDVLRLTNTMPQGGFARCSFDCGMPGEYVFVMETSPDGVTWRPAMEGAYGLLNGPTPRERTSRIRRKGKASTKRAAPKKATTRTSMAKQTPRKTATTLVKRAAKKTAKNVPKRTKKAARGKT